jgi:hypothetical protein
MRTKNLVRKSGIYMVKFNALFAVLYVIANFFGNVDIPFYKWMVLCNTVFFVVILPYLLFMDSRRQGP